MPVYPEREWAMLQPIIKRFNVWIEEDAANRRAVGQKVIVVELHKTIALDDFAEDGLHLLVSGREKMGTAWFHGMKAKGIPSCPR